METSTWAVLIAAGGLIAVVVDKLLGGGWGLASKLSQMEKTLSEKIDKSITVIEDRQNGAVQAVGETIHAMREKVTQIELWARDTFLRKDDFDRINQQNLAALKSLGDKIESRLERMENKIDTKT